MRTLRSLLTVIAILATGVSAKAQNPAINKVLASYIEVKNALFADNSKGAAARAKTLSADITAASAASLSATEKTAWAAVSSKLANDSKQISGAASIDDQRKHFASLSKNILSIVKATKANAATVYVQYCPMKKESWLSVEKEIENPYYGSEMANCGTVKETLQGK